MTFQANVSSWRETDGSGDAFYEDDVVAQITDAAWCKDDGRHGYIEMHVRTGEKVTTHVRFRIADLVHAVWEASQ